MKKLLYISAKQRSMNLAMFKVGEGMKVFLFFIVITSISSCSVIKVSSNDEVNITRKFGFVNVINAPSEGMYTEYYFVGIGLVDNDFVIGYQNSKKLSMPKDACTIFIDNNSYIKSSTLNYLKKINCTFIYLNKE